MYYIYNIGARNLETGRPEQLLDASDRRYPSHHPFGRSHGDSRRPLASCFFSSSARALAAHIPIGMSVYLLYWYKSIDTDKARCARRPPSHPNWAKAKKAGLDHSGDAITDHYLWKQLVLSGVMFQVDSHTTRARERAREREREGARERERGGDVPGGITYY